MKLSRNSLDFIDNMDTHYPRFGEQYQFDFEYESRQGRRQGAVTKEATNEVASNATVGYLGSAQPLTKLVRNSGQR